MNSPAAATARLPSPKRGGVGGGVLRAMTTDLPTAVSEARREGARRFAGWDDAAFDALAAGPVAALAAALREEAGPVLDAYLALLQQGVGSGVLRRATAGPDGWGSFLERCLVERVPALPPQVP